MALILIGLACTTAPESSTAMPDHQTMDSTKGQPTETKTILCFGNSLTAGYGLEKEQAYPALLQSKLDSLGYPYQVINAGVSGETTAGGLARLDWALKQQVDVFILELGANDGLRGLPIADTQQNLMAIIHGVKEKYPAATVVLAGMKLPPNMGDDYARSFEAIFPTVAKEKAVPLIPFFLEGVATIPQLNQADGIHPTEQGTQIVLANVWKVLESLLQKP